MLLAICRRFVTVIIALESPITKYVGVLLHREAGWTPEVVWTFRRNKSLVLAGNRTLDRLPARTALVDIVYFPRRF